MIHGIHCRLGRDEKVARVAEKIVDWHVWTILCMLFLIGYPLGLWAFGVCLDNRSDLVFGLYVFLTLQTALRWQPLHCLAGGTISPEVWGRHT